MRLPQWPQRGRWFAWRPVYATKCPGRPDGIVWLETVSYERNENAYPDSDQWLYERLPLDGIRQTPEWGRSAPRYPTPDDY